MKDIELPRRVIVGDGAINKIRTLISELNLKNDPLIITDETIEKIAARDVADQLDSDIYIFKNFDDYEIENCINLIKRNGIRHIIGVGGGSVIDFTKICAFRVGIPYLSVPTSASHDGITSPQATLKHKKPVSIRVNSPIGIVADTEIIRNAPHRLLASGCADVISNYTAILDWKLAHEEKGEYYGDYAASLSMMSAKIVIENIDRIRDDVSILVEALISSGVAMGIAGSSRPCSGAEHLFSHALDMIAEKPALHGEQCGVGCIMMAYLHNAEWENIRDSLKRINAPTTARELGVRDEEVVKALTIAHKIRDRYTILRDGLTKEEARDVAIKTGVIRR